MKTIGRYFRQKKQYWAAIVISAGLFGGSFWLYGLPLGAVAYPTILSFGVLGLVLIWDVRKYSKKQSQLARAAKLPTDLPQILEEWSVQGDEGWCQIIRAIWEEKTAQEQQAADRAKDMTDYFATWVHQIKTPIAAISLALQSQDDPLARTLRQELFRVEQYVEMVMAYLRLGSSSTDYLFRETDLDKVLTETVKRFASQFITKGIRLEFTPTQKQVVTDEKWLAFALEQILSNSLKYTNQGSITLVWREPRTLEIQDTGMGIAPEDLPRIFEKGYTGGNGRTHKSASGLGLYLTSQACKNLGITIKARSQLGQGTTMALTFPENRWQAE